MQIVIDMPENEYRHIKEIYEKNDIVESTYSYIYHGTPLPEDAEILTAEAYSELCLMASALNDTKSEIKALKKRQWDSIEANVKNENYNPYLAEYLKGYICALSMIEGMIAESEADKEVTE